MSKWEEKRLGELIAIKHGYAFSGENIIDEDNGVVLVTPGNFNFGGGFKQSGKKFFNGQIPDDFILRSNDIIVTMTDLSKNADTLGYAALVPNDEKIYLHNQRIGLVSVNSNEIHKEYLYWIMRTPWYQRRIANTSNGANVKHTSPTRIYEYSFALPDLPTQKRIADILSAYDDFIENNNRRIELLEKAAQDLYKEWFVRFRFPGHEIAKFENGLPKGWEMKKIAEVCETIGGGTPSTNVSEYWENGTIKWVTPTDITNNRNIVLLDVEKRITEMGLKKSSAKLLPINTILMTSRASIGFFGMMDEIVCTNQGFISIVPQNENSTYYLLFNFMARKNEIEAKATGATFKEISKTTFRKMKIVMPLYDILDTFNRKCVFFFMQIKSLKIQNQNLKKQRDLLLPRLMSGKLEV